jgi:hypothetical protein
MLRLSPMTKSRCLTLGLLGLLALASCNQSSEAPEQVDLGDVSAAPNVSASADATRHDSVDSADAQTAAIGDSSTPSGDAAGDTAAGDAAGDTDPAETSDSSGEVEPGPYCGDGVRNGDELCDDGNDDEEDECTSRCEPPRCGDGVLYSSGLGSPAEFDFRDYYDRIEDLDGWTFDGWSIDIQV